MTRRKSLFRSVSTRPNGSIRRWPSTGASATRRRTALPKSGFLLRQHQNAKLQRVMNTWYEQVLCHSKRDQLSMLPSCWFEHFDLEYLPVKFETYELLA